jgi:hypothetical protein
MQIIEKINPLRICFEKEGEDRKLVGTVLGLGLQGECTDNRGSE